MNEIITKWTITICNRMSFNKITLTIITKTNFNLIINDNERIMIFYFGFYAFWNRFQYLRNWIEWKIEN